MTIKFRKRNHDFSPLDIKDCIFWIDASDVNTITLNGSLISQINDKSPSKNHLIQSTESSQPLYTTDTDTGKPIIEFDNINDYLISTNNIGISDTPFTIFMVARVYNEASYNGLCRVYPSLSTNSYFEMYYQASATPQSVGNLLMLSNRTSGYGALGVVDALPYENAPMIFCCGVIDNNNPFMKCNGGLKQHHSTTVTGAGNLIISNDSKLQIGVGYGGSGYDLDGYISEMLIYSCVFSDSEIAEVEEYLSRKWEIPLEYSFGQFSPTSFNDLKWWIDASDSTSVTLNGTDVSQINDKSGNDIHLTQSTESLQPSYTQQINNKNVLTFDGSNYMEALGDSKSYFNFLHTSTDAMVYFVVRATDFLSQDSAFTLLSTSAGSTQTGMWWMLDDRSSASHNNGVYIAVTKSIFSNYVFFLEDDSVHFIDDEVLVLSIRKDTNSSLRFNNDNQTLSVALDDQVPASSDATYNLRIGATASSAYLSGDVCEIIMYDRLLTREEHLQMINHLTKKWKSKRFISPEIIPGMVFWLDVMDYDSILPADVDSSNFERAIDKSGNGVLINQTSSSAQPTILKSGISYRNGLDFNGSSEYINTDFIWPIEFTIIIVIRTHSPFSSHRLLSSYDGSGALTDGQWYIDITSAKMRLGSNGMTITGSTSLASNGFYVLTATSDGENSEIFINSVSDGTGTHSTTVESETMRIGTDIGVLTRYLDSTLFEVLIFDRLLTTEERYSIERSLFYKWNGY